MSWIRSGLIESAKPNSRRFQNMQHPKHKQVNPHNRSLYGDELRLAPHSPLTGISSRLFESAKPFNLQTQHKLLVTYLAITTFRRHGWRHFALGNFKRVEDEQQSSGNISIYSENWQWNHSTRSLLVQRCKYTVRAVSANHGLRRYARLGRGGRGHQDQVTSPQCAR